MSIHEYPGIRVGNNIENINLDIFQRKDYDFHEPFV
jgi:hypothetical protein